MNWIGAEQQWEYRNLDSVYFESIKKDQLVGRKNKTGQIQGVGAKFNNTHDKVVATYNKHGKPVGWVKTYLNSIDNKQKYSFLDHNGKELFSHQCTNLKYVIDMPLGDDYDGYF